MIAGIHQIEVLHREIRKVNGVLVLAHPFRTELSPYYQYGHRPSGLPDVEEVLARPVFRYVDALEACNGTGTAQEEQAVRAVADALGLPVTGGSDAHRRATLGLCLSEFTSAVQSEREFLDAMLNRECNGVDLRTHGKVAR